MSRELINQSIDYIMRQFDEGISAKMSRSIFISRSFIFADPSRKPPVKAYMNLYALENESERR